MRHGSDGIIRGEIRGGEAFALLQLFSTDHSRAVSTVQASTVVQALAPFTTGVLRSGIELPYLAIRGNIADSLNVLIQLRTQPVRSYAAFHLAVLAGHAARSRPGQEEPRVLGVLVKSDAKFASQESLLSLRLYRKCSNNNHQGEKILPLPLRQSCP